MRLVSLSMLKPDMILAKSIYYRECLLLKEGQTELGRFVGSLKNLGIDCVYVEDSKSDGIEIPDAITEETRVSCKRILRKTIDDFENRTVIDLTDMSETIHSIIDDIFANEDMQVSLNDISASDEYTFSHCVSSTVYSLLIAKQLGYSRPMMEKLAAGALFHDIGKILLDKKILNKEGKLDIDEFEHIRLHTTLGYETLKKCVSLTELSRIVALYHHERMDGSGYPTGVKAGELHEFTRIVAVADTYDALVSDRCYRRKWSSNQTVNYLIEHAGTKFDTKIVSVFIKQIAIFPNGSLVRLSDNSTGIVKEQNKNFPLRPIIRIITDPNGQDVTPHEVDLMKILSMTIIESEIEMNGDLP
ncbi:MAG: HD-GYP domain-containing protein [Herbinix sp.]|nr:HD-GYP domain-containing protein [Herbinix sp.]